MAVKSLKELQFPGSADSYTFDATLFDGKTSNLFALLGGSNEFTGKNVFSGITTIRDSEGDMTFGAKSIILASPEGDPAGESVLPSSDDGGQFFLAYASDEANADLSLYAKTSALSSYVTNTSLTNTLKSYVTSSSLSTTLGSYVTKTSLTTTLGDYVTKTSLNTTLGGYAKLASENTYTANNNFNGTTWVKNLSFNGGILNGDSTLGVVCNNSRLRFRTQDGYNVFDMWGSTEFGRLCLKNNEDDKNDTGMVFYSNVAGDYSNVAQFLYAYKDDVLLGTKSFNTWGTYKINGESMCNYRRLTCSISISGGGSGSGNAYGLYVNNFLVKIVGSFSLNVSSGASATVKISWDRQQPTDWNMLNHFMMTGISGSGNSTYTATVTAWNLSVSLGLISSGSRSFVVL